jgi:hypothetical protein
MVPYGKWAQVPREKMFVGHCCFANMSSPMLHLIYYSHLVFAKDGVRGFSKVKGKVKHNFHHE